MNYVCHKSLNTCEHNFVCKNSPNNFLCFIICQTSVMSLKIGLFFNLFWFFGRRQAKKSTEACHTISKNLCWYRFLYLSLFFQISVLKVVFLTLATKNQQGATRQTKYVHTISKNLYKYALLYLVKKNWIRICCF